MSQYYFEVRTGSARSQGSVAADMMRHFYTRQHLGKALVVGEDPLALLSSARKQWMRISRMIQRQRASTLNADKILKYTHNITHMQQLRFTFKPPRDFPVGDIFFLKNEQTWEAPAQCFTVYVYVPLTREAANALLAQLPVDALIVDYCHETPWDEFGLTPKADLETHVSETWQTVLQFLASHGIDIQSLQHQSTTPNIEAMDDALDTLLGVGFPFLQVAGAFQRALELARPLRLPKDTREMYDALSLLAHRVQALSSSAFTQQFLEIYNEDDAMLLFAGTSEEDQAKKLADLVRYHLAGGRLRLAEALQQLYRQRLSAY